MKYIIEFRKTGTICYTSHLDIMKVFKRAFKRANIRLAYSQGFNPHPKMGFAQPLSLGYWSMQEYIEFETNADFDARTDITADKMLAELTAIMPDGLELLRITEAPWLKKTLAAVNTAAEYVIEIPSEGLDMTAQNMWELYMGQEKIMTLKKQKKKPEPVMVDIKSKIREVTFNLNDGVLYINALLDSGSNSNLSPELLITTVKETLGIDTARSEIQVMRKRLFFNEETQKHIDK